MRVTNSLVSNIFDGNDKAYIYIWYSKTWSTVYVGQTNHILGAFARACQHIGFSGTLRCRFEEIQGIKLEVIPDLRLLSYELPKDREFTSIESSYREAVEYLVQIKLLEERMNLNPVYSIISKVRSNARTENKYVKQLAEEISNVFVEQYSLI